MKRMLIPKEREYFHCNHFPQRSSRVSELSDSGGVFSLDANQREAGPKSTLPERKLKPGSLDDQEVLEEWGKQATKLHALSHLTGLEPAGPGARQGDAAAQAEARRHCDERRRDHRSLLDGPLPWPSLERRHSDFPYHVRVITGASGGMVGAAAYVAELTDPLRGRVVVQPGTVFDGLQLDAARRRELLPWLRRDALTPVIRELVLSDLPSILFPGVQKHDRGTVLEDFWQQNIRLDRPAQNLPPAPVPSSKPMRIRGSEWSSSRWPQGKRRAGGLR